MVQAGDPQAFNTLCDRYLPRVYNRLRALLPAEAVEDVTQEVFLAVLRSIHKFRRHSTFRTWLAAIARHKVADYYRHNQQQLQIVPLEDNIWHLAEREGWQTHALVRLALLKLPETYQEILLLRFAEGLPFHEVAANLGISLEATKSRYRRAITAITAELNLYTET